jgi:hypothetical protein
MTTDRAATVPAMPRIRLGLTLGQCGEIGFGTKAIASFGYRAVGMTGYLVDDPVLLASSKASHGYRGDAALWDR